jgi:nucleoid-associated protein YgaU
MRHLGPGSLALADAVALATLRPRFGAVAAVLSHPHAAVDRAGTDGALLPLLALLVWSAAAWLALGLLAAIAARLPGPAGRAGSALTRLLLPRALRTIVAGSAGLGVLLGPVAAGATPAPPPAPSPAWPVQPTGTAPPIWPVTPDSPAHTAPAHTPPAHTPPAHTPPAHTPPARKPPPTHDAPAPGARTVTVARGDSLWRLAGRRLGPRATPARIAREWPRWFAANRTVIGPDPALIRPGQVLRPPARPSEEVRP